MTELYAYSLLPVVAISLLLFFTVALRQRGPWGMAAYCGAIAVWSLSLLASFSPSEAMTEFGLRFSAVGAFVVAGYLHAAYDLTDQHDYRLVWFAYAVAAVISLAGTAFPGLLYDPVSLAAGPLFWPSMGLAVVASSVPLWHLATAYRDADDDQKRPLRMLFAAGFVGYLGAWSNATMLAYDIVLPYGLFLVLGSLLILGTLVQTMQTMANQKLFERSLLYSALTALLSAGFLFGALVFLAEPTGPMLRDYGVGALFLFCMAALAFEPVRQHIQEIIGRQIATDHVQATEIADELVEQEERADQAERLAELGTFTSAIAHEVRNPLGVIAAQLSVLARRDVDEAILDEMRHQIDRASEFLDDLLRYGRPRSLELRMIDLDATIGLAVSSATGAMGDEVCDGVDIETDVEPAPLNIEADQGQLLQVLVILVENALLAVEDHDDGGSVRLRARKLGGDEVRITVADNGLGIEEAVADTLFEPFVTTRKREVDSHGTGLGLAIARSIVERHGGTIDVGCGDEGGAQFEIRLPTDQDVLGVGAGTDTGDTDQEER